MQNFRQASVFKLLSTLFVALPVMLLLSSCSKNMAELPLQENTDLSTLNPTSSPQMKNSLVAVPFDETLFVPCANSGAGENVILTGSTNFVYQMAWNDHGFTLAYHANSHGVTGIGSSSGDTFVGSEGTQGSVMGSWVNNQWIGTTIDQVRIIGKNTSYIIKYKYQLIITPDGNVAVTISDKTVDCKM